MTRKTTLEQLRSLPATKVIDLLEERLGRRLPLLWQLKISILLGAGDQGIHVVDPSPNGESPFIERVDWERLAALLNSESDLVNAPPHQTEGKDP